MQLRLEGHFFWIPVLIVLLPAGGKAVMLGSDSIPAGILLLGASTCYNPPSNMSNELDMLIQTVIRQDNMQQL